LHAFYSDHFVLPLPAGHRFPMEKYRALRERVASELPAVRLAEADAATDAELGLAHAPDYVARVAAGALSAAEQRAIGFPWSPAMVERSRRSAGATIAACRAALAEGIGVNLAGGTHHAYRDRGQGFCVFNDAAVATRLLQAEARRAGGRLRVAVIDLDVHQGNGTASILAGEPEVFTLSLHGEKNFPFRKEASSLDVGLPDGTTDDVYLQALDEALGHLAGRFEPDLLIYLAGADAHEGDRLGRLRLTTAGMLERDRRVFRLARQLGIPIAVAMAGGYGHAIETTVEVHFNTVALALTHWQAHAARRAASAAA
jgi:acetoin utilization deacetylase AcuC-like enzyme